MAHSIVYLLDTNIWLERLLGQENAEVVGRLLDVVPSNQLLMSDFTLHSIGVILGRLKQINTFTMFVEDVLLFGGVQLVSLPSSSMPDLVRLMQAEGLDFDDAYQYAIAIRENVEIVSFDSDFDRTTHGRITPAEVLQRAT